MKRLILVLAALLLSGAADAQTIVPSGSSISTPVSTANGGTGVAGSLTGARKANGASPDTQAACADLSNAAPSCATDATNASNIQSGNLADARMPSTAWTAYSASPSCGTATFTSTARYKIWGKTAFVSVNFIVTSIGTCTGNLVTFNLPSTANSAGGLVGAETAVNGNIMNCRITAGSGASICVMAAGTAIANGFNMIASGVYESQ